MGLLRLPDLYCTRSARPCQVKWMEGNCCHVVLSLLAHAFKWKVNE